MSVDVSKIQFFSQYPIDMIVQSGELSISNDGVTTSSSVSKIVTDTVANDYGRAALARARWSTDGGTNWQSLETQLVYTFDFTDTTVPFTDITPGLQAAISIGCSNSTVFFRTANGYHGNVTFDGVNESYTPNPLTFRIQYALYEVGV